MFDENDTVTGYQISNEELDAWMRGEQKPGPKRGSTTLDKRGRDYVLGKKGVAGHFGASGLVRRGGHNYGSR